MDQNSYVYDAAAGELSSKKNTAVIGLITPTIKVPAFADMTSAVQQKAIEKGYTVIITNSLYNIEEEKNLLILLLQRRVAGVIITCSTNEKKELVKILEEKRIPYVLTWDISHDDTINFVGYDNFKASYEMTKYLISLRHRRIGVIIGPSLEVARIKKRLNGYIAALKDHKIPYDPNLIIIRENTHIDGKEGVSYLLSFSKKPTAVFAATSSKVAIGALAGVKEKGYKVPDDISIAAFGDIDYAADCDPPLTTVRVPTTEMGVLATEVLLDMIKERRSEVRQYCLNTDLIIRKSCSVASTIPNIKNSFN
jgi:DNA-binding LacI/PurR family transcriptional regulator